MNGCITKAPRGGTRPARPPAKRGPKRSVPAEAHGVGWRIVSAGANQPDIGAAGTNPGSGAGQGPAAADLGQVTGHQIAGYGGAVTRTLLGPGWVDRRDLRQGRPGTDPGRQAVGHRVDPLPDGRLTASCGAGSAPTSTSSTSSSYLAASSSRSVSSVDAPAGATAGTSARPSDASKDLSRWVPFSLSVRFRSRGSIGLSAGESALSRPSSRIPTPSWPAIGSAAEGPEGRAIR